jgi:hypothetical protein
LRGIKIDAKIRAKGFMFFAKLAMKLEEILFQVINMCPLLTLMKFGRGFDEIGTHHKIVF